MGRKKANIHYIYKTTCNLTGRWYVGMHSTSNLEDGYMGSGTILRHSVRKHGKENHTKDVLEFCESREALVLREIEIITKELLSDGLCMNLKEGGNGGFINKEHMIKCSNAGNDVIKEKIKNNLEFRTRHIYYATLNINKYNLLGLKHKGFDDKNHSDETKELMSQKRKGTGVGQTNSQYGTCWVTNGVNSVKIIKGSEIPEGYVLGRKKF
jgi:hypothetical protein